MLEHVGTIVAIVVSVAGLLYGIFRDRSGDTKKTEEKIELQFEGIRRELESFKDESRRERIELKSEILREREEFKSEIRRICREHDLSLAEINTKVGVFWKTVGMKSARALHSPGHPRRDYLIERFERDELTWNELKEFTAMLREVEGDMEGPRADRLAAGFLLTALEQKYEPVRGVQNANETE